MRSSPWSWEELRSNSLPASETHRQPGLADNKGVSYDSKMRPGACLHVSGSEVGLFLIRKIAGKPHFTQAEPNRVNCLTFVICATTMPRVLIISMLFTPARQMDQVTQQNAAMVEQSTAASRHLASETQALESLIGFFHVGHVVHAAPRAKPAPRPVARVKTRARAAASGAVAHKLAPPRKQGLDGILARLLQSALEPFQPYSATSTNPAAGSRKAAGMP